MSEFNVTLSTESPDPSANRSWETTRLTHPALGAVLLFISCITIFGNSLVIVAVVKERYLRHVTNFFIVSLAVADLIIGSMVIPFSVVLEIQSHQWPFGSDWCDVWHSLDVLASTASILNLSVIALDRYWAIIEPISYPRRMSSSRAIMLIAIVWLCSAMISFPAIIWWRLVSNKSVSSYVCAFTDDAGYLIVSSFVSFYFPVTFIIFAYCKIYAAASAQQRSLRAGEKILSADGSHSGQMVTLRMHRGVPRHENNENNESMQKLTVNCDRRLPVGAAGNFEEERRRRRCSECPSENFGQTTPRKWKHFAFSKKLSRLGREQKAAKTLGIVMGVFCMCWVPFFVTNLLFGICKETCVPHADLVFPVFTWLGYLNSGMNPIIYAYSMKDFRRAFIKILFLCCPCCDRRRRQSAKHFELSCSSSTAQLAPCHLRFGPQMSANVHSASLN